VVEGERGMGLSPSGGAGAEPRWRVWGKASQKPDLMSVGKSVFIITNCKKIC